MLEASWCSVMILSLEVFLDWCLEVFQKIWGVSVTVQFWTGVRGSEFCIRKVPFYRFQSFQIPAFDLRRERNSKHFRLEKIQIWSSVSEKCHFADLWVSRFWLLICVEDGILSTLDSRKFRFGVREVTPLTVKVRGPGVPFCSVMSLGRRRPSFCR